MPRLTSEREHRETPRAHGGRRVCAATARTTWHRRFFAASAMRARGPFGRRERWRMDWVAALALAVTLVVSWVARDL